MSGNSPTAPSAQGSVLSYEEIKQVSQQKEALRVSQLYGSGAGAVKNLTMAGKKKQGNTFVSEGIIHFPFDPEIDSENAKIKIFNCREIHKGEGRAAFGGGVRLLEQAVTSASASFNEILSSLSVTLKLKLEPTELAALLAGTNLVPSLTVLPYLSLTSYPLFRLSSLPLTLTPSYPHSLSSSVLLTPYPMSYHLLISNIYKNFVVSKLSNVKDVSTVV